MRDFFYFYQIFRILVTVSCRGIRATPALQLISYDYVYDSYMCHFFKTPSDLCSFLPDLTLSSIVKLICWYLRLLVKTTAADVDLSILKPSLRVKREWRFRVQKRWLTEMFAYMGFRRNVLPRWGNVNILLIQLSGFWRYTSTKRFVVSTRLHHKENTPWHQSQKKVLRC